MNNSKAHSELVNAILLECGGGDTRLFKNAVGVLQDRNGRYVRYGVCNPGGSDLIGWTSIHVTQEMVGQRIAVFVGIEVKTGTGSQSKEQKNFQTTVENYGGKSGVARSVQDAAGILANRRNSDDTP